MLFGSTTATPSPDKPARRQHGSKAQVSHPFPPGFGVSRRVLEPGAPVASLDFVDPAQANRPGVPTLDERTRLLLDFERESWKLAVRKERAIRERFGFSTARYHQLLNRAIDRPEALAFDPMLVLRLRRLRDVRRRRREAGKLGIQV